MINSALPPSPPLPIRHLFGLLAGLVASFSAFACWEEVGQRYGVNPYLLGAIAKQESRFNANAVRQNSNGTRDIGVMQINSIWLPKLAQYGITEKHLFEPCVNIAVGAWILRQHQLVYGNTWEAVGAFHSKTPSRKWKYAESVNGKLKGLLPPP